MPCMANWSQNLPLGGSLAPIYITRLCVSNLTLKLTTTWLVSSKCCNLSAIYYQLYKLHEKSKGKDLRQV